MNKFAERLKAERKRQNLTQQDLAEQLHISRTSISNWEVGRNYPDLEMLIKLSDVLDLSLDHLLKEDTDMTESYAREIKVSSKRKKIIKVLVGVLIALIVIVLISTVSFKFFVVD